MPQAVEIGNDAKSIVAWRYRHIFVITLAACTCLSISIAAAEDDEIPAEAPLVSANTPPVRVDPSHARGAANAQIADFENDPILGLVSKLKAKPEEDTLAIVIDIGADGGVLPKVKGPWALAREEAGPLIAPAPRAPQPGDPEWRPTVPLDDDELALDGERKKPSASVPAKIKASDPERQIRWSHLEESAAQMPKSESKVAQAPVSGKRHDRPRFPSGSGLDSEAAEAVSAFAISERAVVETKEAEKTPEPEPHPKAELIAKLRALAESSSEIPSALKKSGGPGKNPPVDSQKRYEDLITQLEKNFDRIADKFKEATDKTVQVGDGEEMRVRDARAAKAMEVLLSDTPLGTLEGAIGDNSGKHFTVARVRVTDVTDTAIHATLPEGFWCNGRFSVQAVSGPVKVEISGGRFRAPYVHGLQLKPNAVTPIEVAIARPAALNFASRGWYLADLDMPLRVQPGERAVWLGGRPEINDLMLAARAEGVQILGIPLPADDLNLARDIESASAGDLLILPALPGPRHAFHGCGLGLGIGASALEVLPREFSQPELPLREAFEEIRARGGIAIYKELGGLKTANIKRDIFPLFPRLQQSDYYPAGSASARLYAANELMFDTVVGPAYDAISFDGSPAAEALWFNLLNQGYSVSVIGAGGGSLEGGRVPFGQTFIKIDGAVNRDTVLDSIKNGRTSVSFGPAAFCKVLERDKGPGASVPADGRRLTLQIEAYASMLPGAQLDTVEIIRNGKVVHVYRAAEGESQLSNFAWPVAETASSWYVVRVTERRVTGTTSSKGGCAWTGAIYFRGAAHVPPAPAVSRISGTLRCGLTPVAGTVTTVIPGQRAKQIATDASGRFFVELPAAGTLIFEAPGCEPVAKRVFEHPKVQQALGALGAEKDGGIVNQFSKPALFPSWKLMLSELEWNIVLPSSTPFKDKGAQE